MRDFYKNKKIVITGHTGFKGSWLSLMLKYLGSNVYGYALKPNKLSLYNVLNLKTKLVDNKFSDIRNYLALKKFILNTKPDIIFHLAAQSIVSEGYMKPKYTWDVNVDGTVNLLKITEMLQKKCTIIIVTTDKVYKDLGKKKYDENSDLEGNDPYSSSKVVVEKIVENWKKVRKNKKIKISVARAGNVIGGGDWSKNRLIPDLIKNAVSKKTTEIRNPNFIRPWQYVIKVLEGYLLLAKKNYLSKNNFYNSPFNFGPKISECKMVKEVIKETAKNWQIKTTYKYTGKKFKETSYLLLNSKKAKQNLEWNSSYSLAKTIKYTSDWYKIFYYNKKNIYEYSLQQIKECIKI